MEAFDFKLGRWEPLPQMGMPRSNCAAAALFGQLYVVGGWAPGGFMVNDDEVFDAASSSWSHMPAMPTRRASLTAASLGGALYAMPLLARQINIGCDTCILYDARSTPPCHFLHVPFLWCFCFCNGQDLTALSAFIVSMCS